MPDDQPHRTSSEQWETVRFPSGVVATLNSIGCLFKWATNLQEKEHRRLVLACVGKPTAPVFPPFQAAAEDYWKSVSSSGAIDYGDIQGDIHCRKMMACALEKQYRTEIHPNNIIFIAGGKSGLQCVSNLITQLCPGMKVVTAVPYYPDYKIQASAASERCIEMILVNIIDQPCLTADLIALALQHIDPDNVGAFILNDPNNPMGTVIGEAEWGKIAQLFHRYPNAMIILDEAYAEIVFDKQHISLITVAPELKHRIILLRSATKGFSAAGERIATIAAWNQEYIERICSNHCDWLIHAPRSLQYAYAYAMKQFSENYVMTLGDFYKSKVRWMENLLSTYAFQFTDRQVDGTFYVIGNFSQFKGKRISAQTNGIFRQEKQTISTDVDVVFHLIMEYGLVFLPLSLLGVDPSRCLCRITCSVLDEDVPFVEHQFVRMRSDLNAMANTLCSANLENENCSNAL